MVQKDPMRPAKRGRPRAYDPDKALQSALRQFWTRGYAATSLDDLSEATGMNRPSLYAAFGDKRALYLAALERYREVSMRAVADALSSPGSLREALRRFYTVALDVYLSGERPRGCFAIGTALTEGAHDPEIGKALLRLLTEIDAALEARIRLAQQRDEPVQQADAAVLSQIVSATLHTLAIRGRAGERRAVLEQIVDGTLEVICGPAPKRR